MSYQIKIKHRNITDKILRAFFKDVYPQLGYGFLEKVYPDALVVSLTAMGMKIQQQVKIAVYFQGQIAGEYSPISRSMIWSLWNLKLLPASWLNMKLSC